MIVHQQKILLENRPQSGIWGGLWSLPECDLDTPANDHCERAFSCKIRSSRSLPVVRHTFSHFHLDITPVIVDVQRWPTQIQEDGQYRWINLSAPIKLGLAAPVKQLLTQLKVHL